MGDVCKNVFEAILKYGHDEDFDPEVNDLFFPTDAPAGSAEKIEILRRRLALVLWRPNADRQSDHDEGILIFYLGAELVRTTMTNYM